MAITLTIQDQTTAGKVSNEFVLDLLSEHITVQELIRSRVYQEVKDHNLKQNRSAYNGLVQPDDSEVTLNGYRLRNPRALDWKRQYDIALDAFKRKAYIILLDDRQLTSLDETITVGPDSSVFFLKLVPLAGG